MNTETMYDGVTVANLPVDARVYAGYVNGDFANYGQIIKRFPNARVFGIDVLGTDWTSASIIDWEPGNPCYTFAKLKRFVMERENFMPHTACVYCDRANLPEVEVTLKDIWHVLWITTLDGTILTGQRTASGNLIVATQYAGGLTARYDTSEVMSAWI
jgi:hypothetical protein